MFNITSLKRRIGIRTGVYLRNQRKYKDKTVNEVQTKQKKNFKTFISLLDKNSE
jgi:hypothetical protein